VCKAILEGIYDRLEGFYVPRDPARDEKTRRDQVGHGGSIELVELIGIEPTTS